MERWKLLEQDTESLPRADFATGPRQPLALVQAAYSHVPVPTGVWGGVLRHIADVRDRLPDGFRLDPVPAEGGLAGVAAAFQPGQLVGWALAEELALGSLLLEGHPVRWCGAVAARGSRGWRDLVFVDPATGARQLPFEHLAPGQARLQWCAGPRGAGAALGFEYGRSLAMPQALAVWEAAPDVPWAGAQEIIDRYLGCTESKWGVPSGLVVLLPTGGPGCGCGDAGACLERILARCAGDNLVVATPSTPAQYFHLLRRQLKCGFRKPLILLLPASLWMRAEALSGPRDFLEGGCFQEILPDPMPVDDPARITRVVFCGGEWFHDLAAWRSANRATGTALLRIEQLYPLHADLIEAMLTQYPAATDFVWCQQEPQNMGAWTFLAPRLESLAGARLRYAGHPPAAACAPPAAVRPLQQQSLLESAFRG
jgi:2-oxoglutarate dehydrogenase E1 component